MQERIRNFYFCCWPRPITFSLRPAMSAPVRITAATDWSFCRSLNATVSYFISLPDKAFIASGRFRVTVANCAFLSTKTSFVVNLFSSSLETDVIRSFYNAYRSALMQCPFNTVKLTNKSPLPHLFSTIRSGTIALMQQHGRETAHLLEALRYSPGIEAKCQQ